MSNQRAAMARDFHAATKLSYINLRNKPPLYKSYSDVPVLALPSSFPTPEISALDAVAGPFPANTQPVSIESLAALLYYTAGVIRKRVLPDVGEVHYRAAASAGALYPIETYVVCPELPGLEAGVYHFAPESFSLQQLRPGDYRAFLASAAGGEESLANCQLALVFTAIFWRSTWKYRTRGYRYCLWDNGTMLANLTATASALGLPANLVLGFVDSKVDQLVGVDGQREASLCLVAVGHSENVPSSPGPVEVPDLPQGLAAWHDQEITYPEIRQVHSASLLQSEAEVHAWRAPLEPGPSQNWESRYLLDSSGQKALAPKGLGQVVLQRGSTRHFAREALSFTELGALLENATRGLSTDFLGTERSGLIDLYIIVNSVEGLPPGTYFFTSEQRGLEQLQEGNFREEAGHLCFEQALGADAGVVVFLMTDLEKVLGRYGDRGYRAAQLESGVIGGRLYLCAYSLGLGASGITFYDDEVADFFSPHAASKSTMFVVTLGKTGRPNRVRPFRSQVAVRLDALARGAGQG